MKRIILVAAILAICIAQSLVYGVEYLSVNVDSMSQEISTSILNVVNNNEINWVGLDNTMTTLEKGYYKLNNDVCFNKRITASLLEGEDIFIDLNGHSIDMNPWYPVNYCDSMNHPETYDPNATNFITSTKGNIFIIDSTNSKKENTISCNLITGFNNVTFKDVNLKFNYWNDCIKTEGNVNIIDSKITQSSDYSYVTTINSGNNLIIKNSDVTVGSSYAKSNAYIKDSTFKAICDNTYALRISKNGNDGIVYVKDSTVSINKPGFISCTDYNYNSYTIDVYLDNVNYSASRTDQDFQTINADNVTIKNCKNMKINKVTAMGKIDIYDSEILTDMTAEKGSLFIVGHGYDFNLVNSKINTKDSYIASSFGKGKDANIRNSIIKFDESVNIDDNASFCIFDNLNITDSEVDVKCSSIANSLTIKNSKINSKSNTGATFYNLNNIDVEDTDITFYSTSIFQGSNYSSLSDGKVVIKNVNANQVEPRGNSANPFISTNYPTTIENFNLNTSGGMISLGGNIPNATLEIKDTVYNTTSSYTNVYNGSYNGTTLIENSTINTSNDSGNFWNVSTKGDLEINNSKITGGGVASDYGKVTLNDDEFEFHTTHFNNIEAANDIVINNCNIVKDVEVGTECIVSKSGNAEITSSNIEFNNIENDEAGQASIIAKDVSIKDTKYNASNINSTGKVTIEDSTLDVKSAQVPAIKTTTDDNLIKNTTVNFNVGDENSVVYNGGSIVIDNANLKTNANVVFNTFGHIKMTFKNVNNFDSEGDFNIYDIGFNNITIDGTFNTDTGLLYYNPDSAEAPTLTFAASDLITTDYLDAIKDITDPYNSYRIMRLNETQDGFYWTVYRIAKYISHDGTDSYKFYPGTEFSYEKVPSSYEDDDYEYTFKEWNSSEDGTGEKFVSNAVKYEDDVTFYAIYDKKKIVKEVPIIKLLKSIVKKIENKTEDVKEDDNEVKEEEQQEVEKKIEIQNVQEVKNVTEESVNESQKVETEDNKKENSNPKTGDNIMYVIVCFSLTVLVIIISFFVKYYSYRKALKKN